MSEQINQLKQDFTEGLSQISKFWGFPKGMGAIFAVLYLSPPPCRWMYWSSRQD